MDYVWYASYGSNLLESRFHCYIGGGQPEGSSKAEIGCSNPTLPIKVSPIELPFEMYFAEFSGRWNGGVSFIDHQQKETVTYGKKYLITIEQFQEIVQQENGDPEMEIDLSLAKRVKMYQFGDGWYGNVLYLGGAEGHPIFTFTDYRTIEEKNIQPPSTAYITTIYRGLLDAFPEKEEVLVDYLYNRKGIVGHYSYEQLKELLVG